MDEDGGDAKESEVTRDGQSAVAVHPLLEPPTTFADCETSNGPSMTSDSDAGQLIESHAI